MFAVAADYLMGWAMASADGARKQQAEWPPHPDRVFMALAAAWFETGCDPAEGAALRWLEALPPPALHASACELRDPVTHYVPVNDAGLSSPKTVQALVAALDLPLAKAKDAGLSQLPELRSRQPRSFPVALPHDPVVHLCWAEALPAEHHLALAALCAKVTSIGHSASVVRMWVDVAPPPPNRLPADGTQAIRLRVSGAGRLDYLERRINKQAMDAYAAMQQALQQAKGKARKQLQQQLDERFPVPPVSLRPEPGLWQAYVPVSTPAPSAACARSLFDERLVVLALGGPRLSVLSTLQLTAALRGAMLSGCAQPLPAWLSGHQPNGAAARDPHVALLPLAYTQGAHADGRLLGVALALPRSVPPPEAARVLQPWLRSAEDGLPREFRLYNGRELECTAMLDLRERPPATLDIAAWVGPARRWATVTPVVLDRHASGADQWERAAATVADACAHIGLPQPVDLQLHPSPAIAGVPPAGRFAPLTRKRDGSRMAHTHAVITFDTEVLGPVALGAGRFRGYGFCRPLPAPEGGHG